MCYKLNKARIMRKIFIMLILLCSIFILLGCEKIQTYSNSNNEHNKNIEIIRCEDIKIDGSFELRKDLNRTSLYNNLHIPDELVALENTIYSYDSRHGIVYKEFNDNIELLFHDKRLEVDSLYDFAVNENGNIVITSLSNIIIMKKNTIYDYTNFFDLRSVAYAGKFLYAIMPSVGNNNLLFGIFDDELKKIKHVAGSLYPGYESISLPVSNSISTDGNSLYITGEMTPHFYSQTISNNINANENTSIIKLSEFITYYNSKSFVEFFKPVEKSYIPFIYSSCVHDNDLFVTRVQGGSILVLRVNNTGEILETYTYRYLAKEATEEAFMINDMAICTKGDKLIFTFSLINTKHNYVLLTLTS